VWAGCAGLGCCCPGTAPVCVSYPTPGPDAALSRAPRRPGDPREPGRAAWSHRVDAAAGRPARACWVFI